MFTCAKQKLFELPLFFVPHGVCVMNATAPATKRTFWLICLMLVPIAELS